MTEPLELTDITGLTMTVVGVLIESYVKEGYADPTMFRALNATTELAEQFKARLEFDGTGNTDLIDGVGELITNLKLTAMECGEVVERIIEANGWQEQGKDWSNPHHGHNHDQDGED
jgi:hypothetical protein